ncbi:MAG: glycosyltransferase, partial [Spirochaetia bacterium]|nr:glycosyltransferase [Spirochaetia bacterium]
MSDVLYVVLPAYNEEENIEAVVKSWYAVLDGKDENSRIVIADSGSKDKTHEILTGMQKDFPKLVVLSKTGRFHGEKV